MKPPHSTPNEARTTKAWCAHCTNTGMVLLDGDENVGGPCPMCRRGLAIDLAEVGAPSGFWYALPESTTWENGLTVRHIRKCQHVPEGEQWSCGRPSVGQWCDHHAVAANRGARPAGSVQGLLRGVRVPGVAS